MKTWQIRAARANDVPAMAAWLPQGATRDLPEAGIDDNRAPKELWLVAEAVGSTDVGADSGEAMVGASLRVRRAIGVERLRHWYHVGCVVHASTELRLFHRQHTLLLGNDHTGASELADLACDSASLTLTEQAAVVQMLLRAALLLIARDREHYSAQLIVELPGMRDSAGQSPFWEGLGRHFYHGDPLQAAQRFGPVWRSYVAALLPRQLVYTSFLPPATQAAIAQVAHDARVMIEALSLEGLRYGHHVAIDDAGPVYEAHIDSLPIVLAAQRRRLVRRDGPRAQATTRRWLIAADAGSQVILVRACGESQELHLAQAVADFRPADAVWAVPLTD